MKKLSLIITALILISAILAIYFKYQKGAVIWLLIGISLSVLIVVVFDYGNGLDMSFGQITFVGIYMGFILGGMTYVRYLLFLHTLFHGEINYLKIVFSSIGPIIGTTLSYMYKYQKKDIVLNRVKNIS